MRKKLRRIAKYCKSILLQVSKLLQRILYCILLLSMLFLFLSINSTYSFQKKFNQVQGIDQPVLLATLKTTTNDNKSITTKNASYDEHKAFTYEFGPLANNLAQMQRDGVISSYRFTLLLFKMVGLEKNIKRGVYTFKRSDSLPNIMERLRNGIEDTHLITIPEGYDIYDIDARLLSLDLIAKRLAFVNLAKTHPRLAEINALLNLNGKAKLPTLEGALTPESYRVRASIASNELITLATSRFISEIVPYLKKNVAQEKWKQTLTIASLVEKETIVANEKTLVSAVVFNRLQEKMKLRYDPSIIYAMKVNNTYIQNLVDGKVNIKKSHFLMPSKYNTYYIKGLPPGPITNPTLSSVQAAANPASVDYLFFVAKTKGNHAAGHYFSTTYEEHLANIRKYRKSIK